MIAPCPTDWGVKTDETIDVAKEELAEGIKYAHQNNCRAYVTLNTLPRNDEIAIRECNEMQNIILRGGSIPLDKLKNFNMTEYLLKEYIEIKKKPNSSIEDVRWLYLKGPNKTGYDKQTFLYCFSDANRNTYFGNKDVFFGTYGAGHTAAGTTREQMITKCSSSASYCTRLLQNDQWEFKGDYPFKF